MSNISDIEFGHFQRFIFEAAGITLTSAKKALVSGRLAKRLQACRLKSYGEYFRLVMSGTAPQEAQLAVDFLHGGGKAFILVLEPDLDDSRPGERQALGPHRTEGSLGADIGGHQHPLHRIGDDPIPGRQRERIEGEGLADILDGGLVRRQHVDTAHQHVEKLLADRLL